MSKLEVNITNNLKMLCIDMIKEAGSGDVGISLCGAPVMTSLFLKYLNFDYHSSKYINRDRVIVSNRLLPLMYATLHIFGSDLSFDALREFKKLNSVTEGVSNIKTPGIEVGSNTIGDVIASSVGIALGERYIESLIKLEDNKCNLINFKTICICTEEDLMNGISYEAMSYAGHENLNKLIFIVLKTDISKDSSTKETFSENLVDCFISLNFNVDEINNTVSSIEGAIEDAYVSKKPSVIIIKSTYAKDTTRENSNEKFNMPLSDQEIAELREKYPINYQKEDLKKELAKRLDKPLNKWIELKNSCLEDLKLREIVNFLETKEFTINFKPENIKINDGYEEELIISNNKIFNIVASKSPFVLSLSNDNFINTLGSITKASIMHKNNPTGRNILCGSRTMSIGYIALGLSTLGFKVFVSAPLIDEPILQKSIALCSENNLDVNFIFTQDTFLNSYLDTGNNAIYEINNLRSIPNLINFRPADINEVIGVYDIISQFKNTTTIIIGSSKVPKLKGSNYKYVMAGAYRVKREMNDANAIIIATGSEVELALRISDALAPYGIDFRVVTMPSAELFARQNERYQNMLLPKTIKTFTLEFGGISFWHKYATSEDYILGIDKFGTSGTKEELLNYYNLDMDSIKAKILSNMKN